MEPTSPVQPTLDPKLARKLLRNLRVLNTLVIFFSLIIISVFAIAGVLAYRILGEIQDTKNSFTSLQQSAEENLDFRTQLCEGSGSVSTLLKNQSDVCANN